MGWTQSAQALTATMSALRRTETVSESIAGLVAARLWFTPWRIDIGERARAREAAWLEGTRSLTLNVAGHRIAAFSAGDGPVVLLVHGWGDRAATMGAFMASLTAAGYRVVGIDLPGHGASSGGQTNAFVMARALRETAESIGGVDAVVGHSMGAFVTILALRDGLSVERVALLAPAVRLDHTFDKFVELFELSEKAARGLSRTIERRFGRGIWDELGAENIARSLHTPALIVHDRGDPQIDVGDGRMLAGAWPGAELVVTEGLGHQKIVRASEVVDRVIGFLAGRRLAGVGG